MAPGACAFRKLLRVRAVQPLGVIAVGGGGNGLSELCARCRQAVSKKPGAEPALRDEADLFVQEFRLDSPI